MTTSIVLRAAAVIVSLNVVACGAGSPGEAAAVPSAPPAEMPPAGDIPEIRLVPVYAAMSFRRPILVTHAGDGSGRLFVAEQTGRVLVVAKDSMATEPGVFLDLRDLVFDRHNEEGLLSLAFHPDYRTNGTFYVFHSADEPRRGVLARYTVSADDPDRADPASREVILEVGQKWGNHNGSTVLFGPDGYLYVSLGDGGWANDPLGSGQDLGTLLGAILRLDVDRPGPDRPYSIPADNPFVNTPGARGEIWAYGLRNVWRMSFDRETGDLWAGDVGQNSWEEIDLIVRGGNYGWNIREGKHPFGRDRDGATSTAAFIDPVVEYGRKLGISTTGGHVYRGPAHPALRGVYFYADYASGRIWGLRYDGAAVTAHREVLGNGAGRYVASFGEDEAGELYVCTFDKLGSKRSRGRIQRIVPK
jgi:quinoprotein glucose dehydrogenase